jgi:zinc D-Ala-D-Ala carboxypeptidase
MALENTVEMPERIRSILESLGIPLEIGSARSLELFDEATDLVTAEVDELREHLLTPPAAEAWVSMKKAAASDGVVLRIVSAFRSVDRQAEIVRRKLERGELLERILEVNAPPGFSEHHTGRAVDLTTDGSLPLEQEFENTTAFQWLSRQAGKFGYRLSYPLNNGQGYLYEPWHWCFAASRQPVDR